MCLEKTIIAGAYEDIAAERKKGRIAGVVSTAKLYELESSITNLNAKVAETQSLMKHMKAPVLPCSVRKVRSVAACLPGGSGDIIPDACLKPDIVEYTDLASSRLGAELE